VQVKKVARLYKFRKRGILRGKLFFINFHKMVFAMGLPAGYAVKTNAYNTVVFNKNRAYLQAAAGGLARHKRGHINKEFMLVFHLKIPLCF
jgi:hypothetical protein